MLLSPFVATLDLSSLAQAVSSLARAVKRSQGAPDDTELRDSVIQRFEYTYELCWKMLKRRIELDAPTPSAIDALGYKDLIREGATRGLIANPEAWFEYRVQRNITAHTYDESKASQVYRTACRFLEDARTFFETLGQRNRA